MGCAGESLACKIKRETCNFLSVTIVPVNAAKIPVQPVSLTVVRWSRHTFLLFDTEEGKFACRRALIALQSCPHLKQNDRRGIAAVHCDKISSNRWSISKLGNCKLVVNLITSHSAQLLFGRCERIFNTVPALPLPHSQCNPANTKQSSF